MKPSQSIKNYSYDFVVVFTIKKENRISNFFNEVLQNLGNRKFCLISFFDRFRDTFTYNCFKKLSKDFSNCFVLYDPLTKNLADAYFRAYLHAAKMKTKWVISMNGGYRHDPKDLKLFLKKMDENVDCVWGYRKKDNNQAPFVRKVISNLGHFLSHNILKIDFPDLTSGFYAIKSNILLKELKKIKKFRSKFHFFDTELKYYLKNCKSNFVPIKYKTENKTVKIKIIIDALIVLFFLIYNNFIRSSKNV